jgi:hypothetical protein
MRAHKRLERLVGPLTGSPMHVLLFIIVTLALLGAFLLVMRNMTLEAEAEAEAEARENKGKKNVD